MAKATPAGIIVEYDDSGGTLVNLTQFVQTLNDVDIESIIEETHSFGDSWEESLPIGVGRIGDIEIGGIYDDTASVGPDALFRGRVPETPASSTRTLKITWNASHATVFETFLISYRRTADRNALTRWMARLRPTSGVSADV